VGRIATEDEGKIKKLLNEVSMNLSVVWVKPIMFYLLAIMPANVYLTGFLSKR